MNQPVSLSALLLSALPLLMLPGAAGATTPEEDALTKAPMPHTTLGGAVVTVHRARTQGYFEGQPDNKAQLARLRSDVTACVANLRSIGRPVNPPKVWPDHVVSLRDDTYIASNRSITYSRSVGHGVSQKDCSLHVNKQSTATLRSAQGQCQIDLIDKTAQGDCDRSGHASAPPQTGGPSGSINEAIAQAIKAGMPPAMIEGMRKSAAAPAKPGGPSKTILGVACEVRTLPMAGGNSETMCQATGGKAFALAGHADSLTLEARSANAAVMNAVDVKLDDRVPATIFTPYLAPGFTLNGSNPP